MIFLKTACSIVAIILLTQLGIISNSYADATLHFKDSKNQSKSNSIYIKNGNIHFSDSSAKEAEYSIFDSNNHKLIHINPMRKAYMEIDENTIDKQMSGMKQQMDEMMQKMQQQMKDMPAEQRQMMEQMMGSLGQGNKPPMMPQTPKKQQIKTNKMQTIAGVSCEIIDIMSKGYKTEELCIANENQFKISDNDKKTITKMKNFVNILSGKAKAFTGNAMMEQYDGVPIRTRNYDKMGKLIYESVLESVNTGNVSADKIAIPTGYQKQSMQ